MIKVYKIVTDSGVVEHVGYTVDTDLRYKQHVHYKPSTLAARGKFFKRTDVRLEVISEWETRSEAKRAEMYWQTHYHCQDQQFKNRKLSKEDVLYIRDNINKGYPHLADKFDVHENTIYGIITKKFYKEI